MKLLNAHPTNLVKQTLNPKTYFNFQQVCSILPLIAARLLLLAVQWKWSLAKSNNFQVILRIFPTSKFSSWFNRSFISASLWHELSRIRRRAPFPRQRLPSVPDIQSFSPEWRIDCSSIVSAGCAWRIDFKSRCCQLLSTFVSSFDVTAASSACQTDSPELWASMCNFSNEIPFPLQIGLKFCLCSCQKSFKMCYFNCFGIVTPWKSSFGWHM